MSTQIGKRFKANFSFGALAAERDPLLSVAYWDNGDYEAIASMDEPRCFIIGRTGSGKSAAFRHLEEEYPNNILRIVPENLSLPYVVNLQVMPQLVKLGVHLEPFFRALWKHVILVEIIRHRYKINSPEQKRNIINNLKDKIQRDPAKIRALSYLDEFGDRFWCETDERVKQIADTFERKIAVAGSATANMGLVNAKASGNIEETDTQKIERETATRYQRIVNEAQLPRLNEMIVILNNEILDSKQHMTYLIIDDLDKEWVDESVANLLIRCLFDAVIDMQQIKHLKILVALRTNIFEQLNYGQKARGAQEEKYRGLSLHLRWTENDLRALLKHRAEAASEFYKLEPARTLSDMLPNVNKNRDDPVKLVLSRTLMRPRDAILYLNECIREAAGKDRISWQNITDAERKYSEERLLALRDEWKDPYFDIDKVFDQFRRKPFMLNRTELTTVLDEIALLPADSTFQGAPWLTELCERIWEAGSGEKSWYELYGQLVKLLYNISFIGIAKNAQSHVIYSYNDGVLANHESNLSDSAHFVIHPAFHRALDLKQNL